MPFGTAPRRSSHLAFTAKGLFALSNWYAIRAAVRSERTAERELRLAGFDTYLPEQKIERFNRRKRIKVVSTVCLFPGYLFAQIGPDQFRAARACKGVSDMLPGFPHDPVPLSKRSVADVLELRAAQLAGKLDDTDDARRRRGETVKNTLSAMRKRLRDKTIRVTEGPFMGHVGIVEAVGSLERLKVVLSLFGRPTPVELEMDQVEEMAA